MRNFLFVILALGYFISEISASRGGSFEFYDSRGRCWRCLPGSSCIRCPGIGSPRVPDIWDRTCQKPTGSVCSQNPGVMFPSRCMNFFYSCAADGTATRTECPADKVFDMRQQRCVFSDEITSIGCDNYIDPDEPCPNDDTQDPTNPTFPNPWDRLCQMPPVDVCQQWPGFRFPSRCMDHFYQCGESGQSIRVPCRDEQVFDMRQQMCVNPDELTTVACDNYIEGTCPTEEETTTTTTPEPPLEDTTTTTSNGPVPEDTTTTTTNGGPGPEDTTTTPTVSPPTPSVDPDAGTTTTTPAGGPVTNAPCVCVVWWPCWCNPCWNMPCHSCNGCIGMRG